MAKILVIDDMEDVRLSVDITLESLGHELVEATDGNEGIEALKKNEFDLVITDLHMPGVDGTEVINHIRTIAPAPAVIIMTGGGNKISVGTLLNEVDEENNLILNKPFTGKELIEAVNSVLGEERS